MAQSADFLGRGLGFPLQADAATGRFVMTEGEDNIRQSIQIILSTRPGERAMLPEFGCRLYEHVFDVPDPSCLTLACSDILDALIEWEPRIVDIAVDPDLTQMAEGRVLFHISYTVRATNNPNNLVFPYYLYEGTGAE